MSPKRIMVVEDEGIVALDIQSKLESMGYEVPATVATGEDAVEKAGAVRPDLVLMDVQLAGEMDGTQAAELIHERYDIPVVYLTAFSDERTLNRAKIAEPFGYMLKPFEEKKLHTTIEIALYKHQIDSEKAQLEAQLQQARKMEAIGRLTAGMAHDFTNILQGIQGNIDLALLRAPDELRPFLDAADFDAQRAAQLFAQLQVFYQRENAQLQPLSLAPLIEEVAATCRQVFSRHGHRPIAIATRVDAELPAVRGDAAQLRQCLSNLCTNARDALAALPEEDRRSARIEIAAELASVDQGADSVESAADPHVRLCIEDNGIGMDAEVQEHIFEPFFTTKKESRGLGLSAVYAIVREHRGWVEFASRPGEGTTFSIYLPAHGEAREAEAAERAPQIIGTQETAFETESLRGDEKVLVIADVDRARRIVVEMLESHGYDVLVALDVRDGIGLFEVAHGDIALVVLDLSQPGTSRREVLAQLLAIDAEAAILVASGYIQDSTPWIGARAVLNKPFKTHHLLRAVRQLIDG